VLDSQVPINFNQTRDALLNGASPERTLFLNQVLFQYGILDTLVGRGRLITNAIVSVQARGDTRDNPFAPRMGYVADFGVDAGIPEAGISGFVRAQMSLARFQQVEIAGTHPVLAMRLRAGNIWLLGDVFYVPFDRHFFAGGTNSVRGWGARELRYRDATELDGSTSNPANSSSFVDQIVGNGSVFEGSVELRWKLREQPTGGANSSSAASRSAAGMSGFDEQLSQMGITGFLDIGNAFNSFQRRESYGKLSLGSAVENLAVALGAGFRYDTPAGPFRIDVGFRLYDPFQASPSQRWLFGRPFSFSNDARIQIGLGHAF
jgi:outer membrane protein insertion porin family